MSRWLLSAMLAVSVAPAARSSQDPPAAEAPVTIARHGKPRFVMLSTEQYDRLRHRGETRRSFHVSELTDAEAEKLIGELRDSIDNE